MPTPQDLANFLRNMPNSFEISQTPQTDALPVLPNFVPPKVNNLPRLRQGDEELLKQYGITPEEYYNFQATLR